MQRIISVDDLSLESLEEVKVVWVSMKNPVSGVPDTPTDGFIPGAVQVNLDEEGSDHSGNLPHTALTPSALARLLGGLGITEHTPLLIYDNYGLFCAPRFWWMLQAIGHRNAVLLNGGLPAWKAKGLPLSSVLQAPDDITPVTYQPKHTEGWFCNAERVLSALTQAEATILDARSRDRFSGKAAEPRPGLRSGHMPSAVNVPFTELLSDSHTLIAANELKDYFNRHHIELTQPLICSCGSGVTACVIGLAALEAGAAKVSVYDGSWAEWGGLDHLPVVSDDE